MGDWLSALPDCLLHHIMSFMKARQVVQTSVLSTRWTHLWRSVPCLDVDNREFSATPTVDSDDDDDDSRKFANFVDNLLLFHDASTLDSFRLRFVGAGMDQSRDADRWIRRAIKYCPNVLEIHLGVYRRHVSLPGLGTCSRRLKRLHLCCVSLEARLERQIQFGCPVLEDLELKSCHYAFRRITSHTLKILTIDDCYINIPFGDDHDHLIIITVPALMSLHLAVDQYLYGISVNKAANLVQASIRVRDDYSGSNFHRNLPKLLEGLSSVRNLELTYPETMVPVDEVSQKFPTFSHLRTLFLDMCDLSDSFHTLGHFLYNAPNLEKLILQHCQLSQGSKKRIRTIKRVKPKRKSLRCQNLLTFECPKLKMIEIKSRGGDVQKLFDLLFGIWENLQKTTVVLTED